MKVFILTGKVFPSVMPTAQTPSTSMSLGVSGERNLPCLYWQTRKNFSLLSPDGYPVFSFYQCDSKACNSPASQIWCHRKGVLRVGHINNHGVLQGPGLRKLSQQAQNYTSCGLSQQLPRLLAYFLVGSVRASREAVKHLTERNAKFCMWFKACLTKLLENISYIT